MTTLPNNYVKVRATVLVTHTVTNQHLVRHASASRTAVWLVTNYTLATSAVAEWFDCARLQNLWMNWTRLLCKPFGMSVWHIKGWVALTLTVIHNNHYLNKKKASWLVATAYTGLNEQIAIFTCSIENASNCQNIYPKFYAKYMYYFRCTQY